MKALSVAFIDHARSFTRLLTWLDAGLSSGTPTKRGLRARAAHAAGPTTPTTTTAADGSAEQRLQIVLAMTRGVPPGVLVKRHALPEAERYRLRDVALRAARAAFLICIEECSGA